MRKLTLFFLFFISLNSFSQSNLATARVKIADLVGKQEYAQAKVLLDAIVANDVSKDLVFIKGFVYMKLALYEQALLIFKDYESKGVDNDDYYFYYGLLLFNLKSYEQSLEEFNRSILLGSNLASSYYYSGYIYFIKGDCEKALSFFVKVLKLGGEYISYAHYHSGICLYREGFVKPDFFEASSYHFKKVIDDKTPMNEDAQAYINSIDEYLKDGIIRKKSRYKVASNIQLAFSTRRTITPVEGMPIIGVDSGRSGPWAHFFIDMGASPLLYDEYAFFINYAFDTNLAFSSQMNNTNSQSHRPGFSFSYFDRSRTLEAYASYNLELDFLEQDKLKRIDSANVIELGFTRSMGKTWVLGVKLPLRFYSASSGVLGDFTGTNIELAVVSEHLIGATSLRFEPSMLFFISRGTVDSFQHYKILTQLNLPWKVLFLWPSIKLTPGRLATVNGHSNTYDLYGSLFSKLGLGIKLNAFVNGKKGFVTQSWDFSTGVSMEYVF